MLGDDPPYLSVGTEVSAKYKGAFCEAKIRKVVRSVKCRVTYKQGLGTATVTDEQVKGTLRVGASVDARHNDRKEFVEATITKIQDCSQYTVVFDDGDITTLRRTALCLKSGRHFAESETLDQLPLTHPEHFGNPVIGGRRGRRSRQTQDDSSDDEEDPPRGSNDSGSGSGGKEGPETEPEIGRVVCVELGDKKKKDNWFPGLVVAPTAQDTVRIRVRDDYLVRSFKDARYYTVPKKEATEFTKELVNKVENSALKVAVEKALLFLEKNELPPHWDRDSLFGNSVSSGNSDSDGELDTDSSDDEPREEKDHFVAQLYKFMDDRGTPINNCPMIGNEDIDLYRLFRAVYKLGGYNRVTNQNQWKLITRRLSFSMHNSSSTHNLVKQAYKKFLHSFEDFYRKLGCTMVNHPRGSIRKQRPGRSLIRDKDRNTPVPTQEKPVVKTEKEDEEKEKKSTVVVDEEIKKEKRDIKKEPIPKEEELQVKVKRKEEPAEESASGQDSDVNIEGEESSSSEKSQKSMTRLTPSSGIGNKSKVVAMANISAKNKEETSKKKTVPEKKKAAEIKKQEKKDNEKIKEEDSTKTRSKSKEDVMKINKSNPSLETRETRTPSRESDKKVFTKQRRMTDEELKKRGRKKKEVEGEKGRALEERSIEYAPSYKGPVEIGDRLKVYYGPTHESKVTYEAKVIDMEKDGTEAVYLVHYTGWNTRYDEWIKGSRIAQNFTQAQGRVKRTKATTRPQTPSTSSTTITKSSKTTTAPNAGTGAASSAAAQNRRRAHSVAPPGAPSQSNKELRKEDRESTPVIRSMTPSPLTSCILRTKSPAMTISNRTTRLTRNTDTTSTNELPRRTRRTSGHVDATVVEESESEDTDTLESDVSAEATQAPLRSRMKGTQERNRREARRRAESRMKIDETSDAEAEKDAEEPRRGRRLRKTIGKMQEVKSEPESDEEQPKGRDFDLNQIRSELKGFDKAVKLEIASIGPEPEEEGGERSIIPVKQEKLETENFAEKKIILEPEKKREISKIESQSTTSIKGESTKIEPTQLENTEDIYEFKEPEPFEFEVRNKRDSGGTISNVDKDKDKDKAKKRVFEEDLKSPKKRQKTFNTTITPAKAESKSDSSPTENTDSKKKPRKIFKKNEETEEADVESEDTSITTRELSKFFPTNYSGVVVFKRKGSFANAVRNADDSFTDDIVSTDNLTEDKDKLKKIIIIEEENSKSPKKRQSKTFTCIGATKASELKIELSTLENSDGKKKLRKIFNKRTDETEDNEDGEDCNKELTKFFPNFMGARVSPRKDAYTSKMAIEIDGTDDNTLSDNNEKPKKITEEDIVKNQKKRQKPFGSNPTDAIDTKKKPTRKMVSKKTEEVEGTDETESDEVEESMTTREHHKYFSHYSGPKTKAAVANINDTENPQDRLTVTKTETQVNEPTKLFAITGNASFNNDKDETKFKTSEVIATLPLSPLDSKQGSAGTDKKPLPGKNDIKQELKPLDFMPIVTHALSVPAPISARLPATASIEEKLSAAAVFRSKLKDTKKEDDLETISRKSLKDNTKKSEATFVKKTKDDTKIKLEPDKKKQQQQQSIDQNIIKKDPLQEMEVRKDPLLEVMKKKEEEFKASVNVTITTNIAAVNKTYGGQKKDIVTKIEETWKKAAAVAAAVNTTATCTSVEELVCELAPAETNKDYVIVHKETIVNKIKSSIDRDSIDSTDSSDSERRLTIIDSEDFPDDKCNESSSDLKIKTASSVSTTPFNCITQQEHANDLNQQIGIIGVVGTMLQTKNAKMEEDGENLNSLLCEEEIPGSPTPGSDSMEQEHKTINTQNLIKTDIGSKVAVAFVAAQMPLSTMASATQLANCAMVATMSGGVPMSQSTSGLVTVSMTVQHASVQPVRQTQLQVQPQPQQQLHHQHHHHHQQQQQQQQQQQVLQMQPQTPSLSQIQHQHQQQLHHPQQQHLHHSQLHQQQQQQQQQILHHQQHLHQHQRHEQHEQAVAVVAAAAAMPVAAVHHRESNEAAPVMDNTPPTTPDSSISNISGSPRDERTGGLTPSSEDNNSKTNRDSSEAENDLGGKGPGFSEDDGSSLINSEHGDTGGGTSGVSISTSTSVTSDRIPKVPAKRSLVEIEVASPKKRKKRKEPESTTTGSQNSSFGKKSPRQSTRNTRHGTGSDSDDTSEGSNLCGNNPMLQTSIATVSGVGTATGTNSSLPGINNPDNTDLGMFSAGSPRPTKYNFLIELDPDLDGSQRIAALQQKLTELRNTYNSVKVELAGIERRRKKLKRREREAQKAAKAEMQQACS